MKQNSKVRAGIIVGCLILFQWTAWGVKLHPKADRVLNILDATGERRPFWKRVEHMKGLLHQMPDHDRLPKIEEQAMFKHLANRYLNRDYLLVEFDRKLGKWSASDLGVLTAMETEAKRFSSLEVSPTLQMAEVPSWLETVFRLSKEWAKIDFAFERDVLFLGNAAAKFDYKMTDTHLKKNLLATEVEHRQDWRTSFLVSVYERGLTSPDFVSFLPRMISLRKKWMIQWVEVLIVAVDSIYDGLPSYLQSRADYYAEQSNAKSSTCWKVKANAKGARKWTRAANRYKVPSPSS